MGLLLVIVAAVAVAWRPIRLLFRGRRTQRAQLDFRLRREWLEADFFHRAARSGKPRDLRWVECEFENDVYYARHRRSGELCAFVAVTVAFEAVEDGLMEDVEAVSDLRAATAIFHYRGGRWTAGGRVMFNLDPRSAIEFYQNELEMVAPQPIA